MLETSLVPVGVIKNDSTFRAKVIKMYFLGKSEGGLNIYSNFSKIFMALAMSDGLVIVS